MFRFETVNARSLPTDPEHTLGVEVTDAAIAATLGLGNIDPQHGFGRCGYNGDDLDVIFAGGGQRAGRPDHVPAACTVAAVAYLPPDGSVLATVRPDVDSVAAMAVLVLRRIGAQAIVEPDPDEPLIERLKLIADRDNFRPANGAARPALPTVEQPWPLDDSTSSVDGSERLAALAVICSPNRAMGQGEYQLSERVAVTAYWLLWGMPGSDAANAGFAGSRADTWARIADACGVTQDVTWAANVLEVAQHAANDARSDLARALTDGRMTVRVDAQGAPPDGACPKCGSYNVQPSMYEGRAYTGCAECGEDLAPDAAPIAIVRGLHVGAMGVGYSQADIVVAEMVDGRYPDALGATPQRPDPRKITIAWRERGLVDRDGLLADMNHRESSEATEGDGDHVRLVRQPGTWGGAETILGSPQPGGSHIPLSEIVKIVRGRIVAAKTRDGFTRLSVGGVAQCNCGNAEAMTSHDWTPFCG